MANGSREIALKFNHFPSKTRKNCTNIHYSKLLIKYTQNLCVRVYVCACVFCVGACASVRTRARECVLMSHQMVTADAEMLNTQRFQALSLLRNDVHSRDFIHL